VISTTLLTPDLITDILLAFAFMAFYVILLFSIRTFDEEEIDFIKTKIDELLT